MIYDIAIIGGGIVGSAIAYELSKNKKYSICVIERNDSIIGVNQSTRNGGVIHSGLYYPKDIEPLKAQLCVEGNARMYEFCRTFSLPHRKNGKLIIATSEREQSFLEFFLKTGKENGIPGLEMIPGTKAMDMEPNIIGVTAALWVPSCGVAALEPILLILKQQAESCGVQFRFGAHVVSVDSSQSATTISLKTGETLAAQILINAAGLYADDVARMINPSRKETIVGTRGELFRFNQSQRPELKTNGHHIYQPPYFYNEKGEKQLDTSIEDLKNMLKEGKITKTIGVHLTPSYTKEQDTYELQNSVAVGPLKTHGQGKEDYTSQTKTADDYVKSVNYFFPSLKPEDLEPKFTGIMAVLKGHSDFIIEKDPVHPNCIQLIGMDSPAWTSSLAIARYVSHLL